jgi:cytochrome c nitrite reductase small subunit
MKNNQGLIIASVAALVIAVGLFIYLTNASKALSYLSTDPKHCVNCHVMNTQYATWQHSPHAKRATCAQCHLPMEGIIGKYMAKTRDGWNHSVAFTLNTYAHAIQISENGAERVQANCITCHTNVVETMLGNAKRYQQPDSEIKAVDRKCWDCHQDVAHGKNRSLITTPFALGVRAEVQ